MKKKILYLITGLHTGGAEVVLKNIINSLDKERFEVLVISLVEEGLIARELKEEGIKIISLDWKCKLNIFPIIKLKKIIRKEKPDIIHAHLFHANIVARMMKFFSHKLVIVSTIHSVNFGGKLREFLMRATDILSNKTVVVSKKIYDEMIEKKVISKNKTEIIYNGVDFEYFKNSKQDTDSLKLISVGRLTEAKGYIYLVKAIKILRSRFSGISLDILGEGEKRKEIEKEIENNGLEKNVSLKGNQVDVKKYLDRSEIFISSSLWEGLPIAVCEAMANGKIVVATNVGGTPEVIENGINGFLVESRNEKELADRIEMIFRMAEKEKNRISENARIKIKNNFSNEIMLKNYEELYNKLLEKNV